MIRILTMMIAAFLLGVIVRKLIDRNNEGENRD